MSSEDSIVQDHHLTEITPEEGHRPAGTSPMLEKPCFRRSWNRAASDATSVFVAATFPRAERGIV